MFARDSCIGVSLPQRIFRVLLFLPVIYLCNSRKVTQGWYLKAFKHIKVDTGV